MTPAAGPFSFRLDVTNAAVRFFRLRTWVTQDTPVTLALLATPRARMPKWIENRFSGWGQDVYPTCSPMSAW